MDDRIEQARFIVREWVGSDPVPMDALTDTSIDRLLGKLATLEVNSGEVSDQEALDSCAEQIGELGTNWASEIQPWGTTHHDEPTSGPEKRDE